MESTANGDPAPNFEASLPDWIAKARAGDKESLGKVLEAYRQYLHRIANEELPPELTLAVSPSDLVQETLSKAAAGFEDFRGRSALELVSWLRTALQHKLVDERRRYLEAKRRSPSGNPITRPQDDDSALWNVLDRGPSPSSVASKNEDSETIRAAVMRLRDEYRTVIELRHFEGLTFEEVGARMNRSAEAARKLWVRAVEELSNHIEP